MKKGSLLYVLICAALVLFLGGCLRIERIGNPSEQAGTDPLSAAFPKTDLSQALPPEVDTVDEDLPTDPIRTPELSFTLADVREKNRISELLAIYSCITIDMSDEFGIAYQSFWMKDGDPVYYEVDEAVWDDGEGNPSVHHTENGSYRGISFSTFPAGEPTVLLRVTAEPEDRSGTDDYENYLVSYFPEDENVIEGPSGIFETEDAVSFAVTERYETADSNSFEIRCVCTVDKDTLALREYRSEYVTPDGSDFANSFSVSFDGTKLGEEAMKAWDSSRAVTLDIRTEAGERAETVSVPAGWPIVLAADEGLTVFSDEALTTPIGSIESGAEDIALYVRD